MGFNFLPDQLPGCSAVVLQTEEFLLRINDTERAALRENRQTHHFLEDMVRQSVEIPVQPLILLVAVAQNLKIKKIRNHQLSR